MQQLFFPFFLTNQNLCSADDDESSEKSSSHVIIARLVTASCVMKTIICLARCACLVHRKICEWPARKIENVWSIKLKKKKLLLRSETSSRRKISHFFSFAGCVWHGNSINANLACPSLVVCECKKKCVRRRSQQHVMKKTVNCFTASCYRVRCGVWTGTCDD